MILLISSRHCGGRETCLGAPDPAKLPLQSWPYFKPNSKIQLSKLLIQSPEKPRTLPSGPDVFTSHHRRGRPNLLCWAAGVGGGRAGGWSRPRDPGPCRGFRSSNRTQASFPL